MFSSVRLLISYLFLHQVLGLGSFVPPENLTTTDVWPDLRFSRLVLIQSQLFGSDPINDEYLVVTTQGGEIHLVHVESGNSSLFLDLSDRVNSQGEAGLLGVAFHPNFLEGDNEFYVHYHDLAQDSVIARFTGVDIENRTVDPLNEEMILGLNQSSPIHFGGSLNFGPDGFLYILFGDDAMQDEAQNLENFYGKALRIDIDTPELLPGTNYGIPEDNPLVGQNGTRPEIIAAGFRNPFRWNFDAVTGYFFVGDVGAGAQEEVSLLPLGGSPFLNFGWPSQEGSQCFIANCTGFVQPIDSYSRGELGVQVVSVVGGHVAHNSTIPELEGIYIYGDFFGRVFALEFDPLDPFNNTRHELLLLEDNISTFAQDRRGNFYLGSFSAGAIRRFEIGDGITPDPTEMSTSTAEVSDSEDDGLSSGAIAGIAVAIAVFVAVLILACLLGLLWYEAKR